MDTVLTDELWSAIALYLPEHVPSAKGGRPRVPDRLCLNGILFVLREGIRWQSLPAELGWGSGSTCWRRFQEWTAAGVWHQAHCHLLAVLGERGLLNLERVVLDSASCRAHAGGGHTGPNPTDRAKAGGKRPLLTDACGIPLVGTVGPANHRDATAVPRLLWVLWVVLGCVSGLGHTRFGVERTHSWFGHFRRLVQCYERGEAHFLGMQQLAACASCARRVRHGRQPAEEFQPF